ncbi:ABC transporter permease [Elusimicrobiota bacterium]
MKFNNPSFYRRIYCVWYRHMRVYSKNLITNGFPPFVEPLIFLFAIGLGFGKFVGEIEGVPYITFLATGLLVTTAMFTAAFECSYGTYIRLIYDKAYDGMLSSPLTAKDLLLGEILWAGTKGLFFSEAVLIMMSVLKVVDYKVCFFAPAIGFITGVMFATLSLLITSFIKDINQFNFYFSGLMSPMFFFSGVIFSLKEMPSYIKTISYFLPLTHSVNLVRAVCFSSGIKNIIPSIIYITLFSLFCGYCAIRRLTKVLID